MNYELEFTDEAIDDITYLKKTDGAAYKKLQKLLLELIVHPYTGTGQVETLKHNF